MKALLYQCHAGISGDMHLGAMIDLGVPRELITREMQKLNLGDAYQIAYTAAQKMGISGTRADVEAQDESSHRSHRRIQQMISAAGFAPGVETRASAIFETIAIAEAKIHSIAVEDVHFHEVGAIDSIVDIVAAAIALDHLDVDRIYCGPVELGSGYVNCAHGRYPVPAPATQEILKGVPCRLGGVKGESTTPTGAAILKACVDEFVDPRLFVPHQIGYGVGHKDFDVPNVLRIVLGEVPETRQIDASKPEAEHFKIEANIDDMSPEAFEPLQTRLMALGASDVYFTSVMMKKSRPAICLSVLVPAANVNEISDAVLNHSTTIGLRILPFEKRTLPRELVSVTTSLGTVQVKIVVQPNGVKRWKAEHEDVQRLAVDNDLDYLRVRGIIDHELAALYG
jgi:uncharacterized protein (TIGR00299 family) protein